MLWNSETGIVSGETGMFLGRNVVKLLFPAEKILKVYNSTLDTVYEAGKDFTHEPGSDLLYVTTGTSMPVLPEEALFPPPEKSGCRRVFPVAAVYFFALFCLKKLILRCILSKRYNIH